MKVASHIDTIGHRIMHADEGAKGIVNPSAVIRRSNTILGDRIPRALLWASMSAGNARIRSR